MPRLAGRTNAWGQASPSREGYTEKFFSKKKSGPSNFFRKERVAGKGVSAESQIVKCARVDEAKELRDKAKALAYYAQQRHDQELNVWMSEIRLPAEIRIAEISRELEKVETTGPSSVRIPSGGKPKEQQLAEAGLSTSTANRYEELSAYNEETHPVFAAAAENYFAGGESGVI
jgi:hypothetical protein